MEFGQEKRLRGIDVIRDSNGFVSFICGIPMRLKSSHAAAAAHRA
jgi:hypothetical protein